ncbi:MAG TPA: methyltransferase domain-containing protein [Phycisphaerales bacterium]|nr:methyltransferase domain-containing protein [Phycisphaerales bacterium]
MKTAIRSERRQARPAPAARRRFIREFLGEPKVIGALAPSSPWLAARMVEGLDWEGARGVVEYGPGTGAVTEHILANLRPGARFVAIERNLEMSRLSAERFPAARIVNDNAANVRAICQREGIDRVDLVLSGLPWPSFSSRLRTEILRATVDVLRPGGTFVTFGYHVGLLMRGAWHFRRLVEELFSEVTTSDVVWRNVPPAFIYRCRK